MKKILGLVLVAVVFLAFAAPLYPVYADPVLRGPSLRTGAGLPAADADVRGPLNPAGTLRSRRLVPLAR